jgi:hypothetical protein
MLNVAALTLSLSRRERAMNALPFWGRDRERDWLRLASRSSCALHLELFALPFRFKQKHIVSSISILLILGCLYSGHQLPLIE